MSFPKLTGIPVFTLLLLGISSSAFADDWPQYRGPNRNGISTEKGWLTEWPKDGLKVLWKKSVGRGYSTVSVVGDRLFTLGLLPKDKSKSEKENDLEETISCLNVENGEVVWQFSYASPLVRQFIGARSTPTVDGKFVYVYGQFGELHCLDAATGAVVWKKLIMKELGAQQVTYGYAASPLIVDDLVIVPARILLKDIPKNSTVHPTSDALLLAFKKSNGEEVWRSFSESSHLGGGYWANPVPCTMNGKPCLVYSSGNACLGLEPATGKMLWKHLFSAKDLRHERSYRGCSAQEPSVEGNRVIFCVHPDNAEGFTACLEIDGNQTKEIWRTDKLGNYTSCNLVWQGHVFGIHHNDHADKIGPLYCFDIKTGEKKWEQPKTGGVMTLVDGKFISFTGEELLLLEASTQGYKERARSQVLFGPEERKFKYSDRIAPVLSNGRLYCRSQGGTLICLDVRGK